MILQSLTDYYDRVAADPNTRIAPYGFEYVEISFVIVLKRDGKFLSLRNLRTKEGKNTVGRKFLVPQSVKRSSGIRANFLWDNIEYVLGFSLKALKEENKAEKHKERAIKQHRDFLREIEKAADFLPDEEGLQAVLQFLAGTQVSIMEEEPEWAELIQNPVNLSFRIEGEQGLVCETPAIQEYVRSRLRQVSGSEQFCLVQGKEDIVAETHPVVKGVWGAQSSGGNLVSFNQGAFTSFGKKQGHNSPIGKEGTFAYTTALNHLLRKDSRQRAQVGDASVVFWAEKKEHPMEEWMRLFCVDSKDDPQEGTGAIKAMYESPRTGSFVSDEDDTRFFVLGLSPNAARISVRFWLETTVRELAQNIRRHFDDLRIIRRDFEPEFLSLFRLLRSLAVLGKSENIPPNLAGEMMRAILNNLPYPSVLLSGILQRIQAEREVNYPRAACLKAYLNRQNRNSNYIQEKEVEMALDVKNTNIGYRLGRLFAVLERVQELVNPGINATIRDRYYGAASANPVTVFSRLIKLSMHHLSKIQEKGRVIFFEKLIGEIMEDVPDFPAHLILENQGYFAIGYYHQRQDLFTKREETEASVEEEK